MRKYSITDTETKILQLIALGLNNQTIAEKLYMSPHTVKAHIAKLLKTLNATNRTHITYIAYKAKIIE